MELHQARNIPLDNRVSVLNFMAERIPELRGFHPEPPQPRISMARAIRDGARQGGLRDGDEATLCKANALLRGTHYDPHRLIFGFKQVANHVRDLQQSVASQGGYLVSSVPTNEVSDVLRPYSPVAKAGVTYMANCVDNVLIPRIATASQAAWLAAEGTNAPTTQPVVGQIAMTPKAAAAFTTYSRQFSIQTNHGDEMVASQLLSAAAGLLDQALIAGTGASGQPLGLVNTAGVSTTSGTALAYAGLRTMRKQIITAGGHEDRLAWIGGVDAQDLLGGRERATGGGRFLWDDNGIMGRPAFATAYCPATTLLCGDWSHAVVAIWGPGFTVELDPYTSFKSGAISGRIIVECDVAFAPLAAFSVATAIT